MIPRNTAQPKQYIFAWNVSSGKKNEITLVRLNARTKQQHYAITRGQNGNITISTKNLMFTIPFFYFYLNVSGGGPRVVVSTAAFHARVRGSVPGLGGLKETKNVSFPSTRESQYCGEPPWPRGNVLDLRPPGLEFRILCLEDSVISFISPSSGGSPGPV